MRDYQNLIKSLRYCASNDSEKCDTCPRINRKECNIHDLMLEEADAIEELQNLIAEVGKMVDELIAYAQKNADESREAEQRHYGSDSTVNVYTWMHNVKCVHERYVAKLDDIAAKLPAPPKGVE